METPDHAAAGPLVPDTFVRLDIPVPPNASLAFGYPGTAAYVAFHWEPIGDELCYDDGRIAGTGTWYPFLQYRSHARVAPPLEPWNIGYSDVEPDHWLVLETAAGNAWIATIADALAFLRGQHPPLPPLRIVDFARVREEIRIAINQRTVTPEQMQELHRRQHEQLRQLLRYCDTWPRA